MVTYKVDRSRRAVGGDGCRGCDGEQEQELVRADEDWVEDMELPAGEPSTDLNPTVVLAV